MFNCLRIVIQIGNTKELPDWEIKMLKKLQHSGVVNIVAFIITNQNRKERKTLGLTLFQKFENWWFQSTPDAFRRSSVTKEFNTVQVIDAAGNRELSELNLDLIYCSYQALFDPKLAKYARYGLWYITFGSGNYFGSEPVAFWEVMNDASEIGSSLMIKPAGESGVITVYEGTSTTVPYSVKNTLNSIAWKSSSFLFYRLTELLKKGPDLFFKKYENYEPGIQNETLVSSHKPPANLKIAGLFIRNVFRYLRRKLTIILAKKRFTILFSKQEFRISGIDFTAFTPLELPKNIFWADPFVIEKEERTYIFFEEFVYKKNKAHISVLELHKDGSYSDPVIVLDKPYHLSYPFLFNTADALYMIPETGSKKTVELYKCCEFPFKWEFVENLMENITLIDSTLLFYRGKWWLFGTSPSDPFTSTNDQLFLYYSETLFSPDWKSHPQNPVATHIANCRPAGKIFQLNDKLYRPAQNNSSKQYGYAIKINVIEVLNETDYKEKEVFEIFPDKRNKLAAIHTINFVNNLVVIDGIIRRPKSWLL